MKKICVICGKEFESGATARKTCSLECGSALEQKTNAARKKKSRYKYRVCLNCKIQFLKKDGEDRFCSPECERIYYSRKNRKRRTTSHMYEGLLGQPYDDVNPKLTEDSLAASKLGMSYGEYKAKEYLKTIPKIDVRI